MIDCHGRIRLHIYLTFEIWPPLQALARLTLNYLILSCCVSQNVAHLNLDFYCPNAGPYRTRLDRKRVSAAGTGQAQLKASQRLRKWSLWGNLGNHLKAPIWRHNNQAILSLTNAKISSKFNQLTRNSSSIRQSAAIRPGGIAGHVWSVFFASSCSYRSFWASRS